MKLTLSTTKGMIIHGGVHNELAYGESMGIRTISSILDIGYSLCKKLFLIVDESDKKAYQKFLMGGHRGKTCLCKGCMDRTYKR